MFYINIFNIVDFVISTFSTILLYQERKVQNLEITLLNFNFFYRYLYQHYHKNF